MFTSKIFVTILLWSISISTSLISSCNSNFGKIIPKLELHAHLHGSIRPQTMIDIAWNHSNPNILNRVQVALSGSRDITKCFSMFSILHELVDSKAVLVRIMNEVLEDMMYDNIIYAEIRSTPRALKDGTTMQEYVETLVNIATAHNFMHKDEMIVKLLISIDRGKDISMGQEILDIAVKYREQGNDIIVGVDFSGNPSLRSFIDFKDIFDQAREKGLKITVHAGELLSQDPIELDTILSFRPERLGHALFLEPRHIETLVMSMNYSSSAVEICPTSNLFTLNLQSYKDHPVFETLYRKSYPVSINTDDSGVFGTTLSEEYNHISRAFSLSREEMVKISENTIDQIFSDVSVKHHLKALFYNKLALLAHFESSGQCFQ